jgi:hypothetical protein
VSGHILIHRCKDDSEVDDGLPLRCDCIGRMEKKDAERLVRLGLGRWKKQLKSGGQIIELHDEILMLGGKWQSARTISVFDIEAAYVDGEKYARDRIEVFGGEPMTVKLEDRIAEAMKKHDIYEAVFAHFAGVSPQLVNKIIRKQTPLVPGNRERFAKALTFFLALAENGSVPVCFHDHRKLQRLWEAFEKNFASTNRDDRVASGAVEAVR